MPTVDDPPTTGKPALMNETCFVGANAHLIGVELRPHRLEEADEADEEADDDAALEIEAEVASAEAVDDIQVSGKGPEGPGDADEGKELEEAEESKTPALPEHLRVNYVCQVTKDAREAMAAYDCSGREVLMFCVILFLGGVSLGLTIGLIQSSSKLESGHYLLLACRSLKTEYRRLLDGYDKNVSTMKTRRLEEQLATDKDYVQLKLNEGVSSHPDRSLAADIETAARRLLDERGGVDGGGPCVDLHGHACAAWFGASPAPDFRAEWSVYDAAEYRAKLAARGRLLDGGRGRLRKLYRKCLRWRAGDPAVAEGRPWKLLRTLADSAASLESLFTLVHMRLRFDSFLTVYQAPSLRDSKERGFYLDIRVRQPPLPRRTLLSICRAFRLCELPHCANALEAIDKVERAYAVIMTNESAQFADPLDSRAEPITVEQLGRYLPQLNWPNVFGPEQLFDSGRTHHLYADLTFVKLIGELLSRVNRRELRLFLLWTVARSLHPLVSQAAFRETEPPTPGTPDWIWCLDRMPPAAIGSEMRNSEMGSSLNAGRHMVILLGRRIRDQWLKQLIHTGISIDSRILEKIQRIDLETHIGMKDGAGIGGGQLPQLSESNASFLKDFLQLLLHKPAANVSQDSGNSELQVNAFYNRQLNSIQMSMVNFQPPFFSPGSPDFVNFAGLGSVFGHEIFHSIDSIGHRFRPSGARLDLLGGRQLDVWPPLMRLCAQHLIGCEPEQLTELSDESLADQFGLVMALSAFEETIQHLPRQEFVRQTALFFLSFAMSNCGYEKEPAGSAAPPSAYPSWRDRVNKPALQLRQFYHAFNCTMP